MQLTQIAVQLSIEHQAGLELDLHTRFGIQVNDVFPAMRADEKILTFVINLEQMGIFEQLIAHLEQQKTAGIVRTVEVIPWQENEEGESGSEEPERCIEDDLAHAESALVTLSESWVQNVFGEGATDVLFEALNLFIDARRQRQKATQPQSIPQPCQKVQTRVVDTDR